ncbi:scm-like with four MBT domains protein 1 isoform X2 [Bacillus rossius redtenbacheri]|uniref:scm-like with four MBT domains protein 1 isoform X2 n=1 Tax=Bacillus rossius redtenbacheri TaxID=93214 RepID=UPI002FDD7A62
MANKSDKMPVTDTDSKSSAYSEDDDNFSWQDYLAATNSVEIPHSLFTHVELSLQSELQEGMLLEVAHRNDPSRYWVASIVMACGPLLSLRYVGGDKGQDFWCDVSKVPVHPLGWCHQNGLTLTPPDPLVAGLADPRGTLEEAVKRAQSVPQHVISGNGITPVERIKQGMKLEVQDKKDPYKLWMATVVENVGGRLLLHYITPGTPVPDFWLFYTSRRLFHLGWAEQQGSPWYLQWPSCLDAKHTTDEWTVIVDAAKEESCDQSGSSDLFQNHPVPESHQFQEGMKLEAIHPQNMAEFCPATVVRVFDSTYFLVQIDTMSAMETDDDSLYWLCTTNHPYIFPCGWSRKHGLKLTHPCGWTTDKEEFDWPEYLVATDSQPAPDSCFLARESTEELGFRPAMKLEAVSPEDENQLCAASVVKTVNHLMWIHLECNDGCHPDHVVSGDSLDVFPVGWCESNSYPLKPPCSFQLLTKARAKEKVINHKKEEMNCGNGHGQANGNGSSSQQKSSWCPKIFFNHKCFSGPFLSKGKLAQLPKAVGPGPVTLVMREVLSMLISVAYKSSRVLKELQCNSKPRPGMHLEVLKAKYLTNTYRASVALVTSADKVPEFCKTVCKKLQVCPHLFGPTLVGDEGCPENCSTLSKTRFTTYWIQSKRKLGRPKSEATNLLYKSRKKKKFKPIVTSTTHDSGSESGTNQSKSVSVSSSQELCKEDDLSPKKRNKLVKELPATRMKTRGAKLPNFALQMRAGHWTRRKSESTSSIVNSKSSADSLNSSSPTVAEKKPETCQEPVPVEAKVAAPAKKVVKCDVQNGLQLDSNPIFWSKEDLYEHLVNTSDCSHLAEKCKDMHIDGHAFMLLNFPSIRENMFMKTSDALKLCRYIEQFKFAFYTQYRPLNV